MNVTTKEFVPGVVDVVEPYLWELVQEHGGSISAEHGIGTEKVNVMKYSKSPESIEIMKDLKRYFDPNNILNPYKVVHV